MNMIEWMVPFVTILGVFIANAALIIPLFLWNRAEARADARHNDTKLESTRELVRAIHAESHNIRDESKNLIIAIQQDIRDFHERLIEIERKKSQA